MLLPQRDRCSRSALLCGQDSTERAAFCILCRIGAALVERQDEPHSGSRDPAVVMQTQGPWGCAATLAKALDSHVGKDELEPAHSGLRSLGEPSLHLCYARGLQGHDVKGVGKGIREPRSREPLPPAERTEFEEDFPYRKWNSGMDPKGTEGAAGVREDRSGVHY